MGLLAEILNSYLTFILEVKLVTWVVPKLSLFEKNFMYKKYSFIC